MGPVGAGVHVDPCRRPPGLATKIPPAVMPQRLPSFSTRTSGSWGLTPPDTLCRACRNQTYATKAMANTATIKEVVTAACIRAGQRRGEKCCRIREGTREHQLWSRSCRKCRSVAETHSDGGYAVSVCGLRRPATSGRHHAGGCRNERARVRSAHNARSGHLSRPLQGSAQCATRDDPDDIAASSRFPLHGIFFDDPPEHRSGQRPGRTGGPHIGVAAVSPGPEIRSCVSESLLAQYGVESATALHAAPVFAGSSRRMARGCCHLFPVLPTVLAFLPVGAAIGT